MPSLFEDFIDITNYKFYTKKLSENRYLSFAYDEAKIIKAIKQSNLSLNQVNNIYFGQIELKTLLDDEKQSCMKVDNICLSYIDEMLTQIPIMLKVNINNELDIQNLKLSSHKIYINAGSKYIDTKSTYTLAAIFMIFSLFVFSKVINNNILISKIPEKISVIQEKANMPATMIQTKSIITKLEKTALKQTKVREIFEYLLKSKATVGGTIVSLDFKNEQFVLKYKEVDEKRLTSYLEKKYQLTSAVVKDGIFTIGLKI